MHAIMAYYTFSERSWHADPTINGEIGDPAYGGQIGDSFK